MQLGIEVSALAATFVVVHQPLNHLGLFIGLNLSRGPLACLGCGGCLLPIIGFVAVSIALLVWVARDAKARGMDSAVLWMLLVFFLNILGFVIYLFARPQGITIPCPNCGNKRLQASVRCPHCGVGA